ncbi:hypothetical protein QBC44DRAFT_400226 [Cladorrhinum sp. PSN332]|nr:hypothetical protein QBC44DRAFT_400226 [Cladorrhinum sp. PSN332]
MSHPYPTSTPLRSQSTTAQHKDYETVHVLLIKFKYEDLQLENEMNKLESTYSSLGYSVSKYEIGMKDDWRAKKVKKRLGRFLKRAYKTARTGAGQGNVLSVIHYSGHGGCEREWKGFYLSSHNWPTDAESVMRAISTVWRDRGVSGFEEALRRNRNPFQPVAGVYWSDLSPTIMKAECDTLVILDCCCAGLATVSSQHPGALGDNMETVSNYRKELIGACGWFVDTYGDMSDALCSSLQRGLPNSNRTILTHTLVRLTNNRLVQLFNTRCRGEEPPQAVHYLLQRNNKNKMILPRFERGGGRGFYGGRREVINSGTRCVNDRVRELEFIQGEDDVHMHEEEDDEYDENHDHSTLPDADYCKNSNNRLPPASQVFQGTSLPEFETHGDSGVAATAAFFDTILHPSGGTIGTQAPGRSDGFDVDFDTGLSLAWDPTAGIKDPCSLAVLGQVFGAEYGDDDDDDDDDEIEFIGERARGTGSTNGQQPENLNHRTPDGQRLQQPPPPPPLRSSTDKYPDHPWKSPTPPPGSDGNA